MCFYKYTKNSILCIFMVKKIFLKIQIMKSSGKNQKNQPKKSKRQYKQTLTDEEDGYGVSLNG